jgi:phosphatidate cytidylyltransferase
VTRRSSATTRHPVPTIPSGAGPTAAKPPAGSSHGRAGRNLPMAILVGLVLGILIVGSLTLVQWGFTVLATASVAVGVMELRAGLREGHIDIPIVPVMAGTLAMGPAAYAWGPQGLLISFGVTVLATVLARALSGDRDASRDVMGGIFVAGYAPFLAAFSALMLIPADGPWRVFVFVLVGVMSDVGGYAAGVLAGRHPMAPTVSPKKSWEGFAGSAAACIIAGSIAVPLALHGSWWAGALLGAVTVLTATLGDLTESMVKRDLGVKDLGSILPGHGGLMDRLDSLLLVAPVAWALLSLLVPAAA